MGIRRASIAALAALLGCDGSSGGGGPAVCGDDVVEGAEVCDDGVNDAIGGGCLPGCGAVDDSDALFARAVLDVDLAVAPADWETLRHERQTRHEAFGRADCLAAPVPSPYRWVTIDATIDGERIADVGLRKKGAIGSQSTLVPSLKLRFDREIAGQRHHGLARLALNNSRSDPSYARTCVSYRVFAAAGLPTPRCTLARVAIDGAPLGVYVAVEEIGADFLARRQAAAGGALFEGTASDFRSDYVGSFDQESGAIGDRAQLAQVTAVLESASDAELIAELAPLVDVDGFYRFWAAEGLLWHRDGYAGNANNFFVHADPAVGGRLRFIPWGPDNTLRPDDRDEVPDSVLAFGALAARLYGTDEGRARYHAELAALLDEVWAPDELAAEVARISAAIAGDLTPAEAADQAASADELVATIAGRRAAIAAALAAGQPAWTAGLRPSPCRLPLGPVSGSFATTWDTLGADLYVAGSGTLMLALDGEPIAPLAVGARAGRSALDRDRVQVAATLAGEREVILTFDLAEERWFESLSTVGVHELVTPPATMGLREIDRSSGTAVVVRRLELGAGSWTVEAFGRAAGAEVRGTFAATLYQVP